MKIRSALVLGGVTAASVCTPAQASYQYLSVQKYATVNVGGGTKWVYRVYANFNNPNDHVTAVAGSDVVGAVQIQTRNATDTAPGSNFFNPGGNQSNKAPYLEDIAGNPDLEWGTFVTIGVGIADQGSGQTPDFPADQTGLSPSFPTFINGNSFSSNNISWFTAGPVEQGRAGYLGDGDAQLRVMIMQLTVNAGDYVKGTVSVSGTYQNDAGGNTAFTANGQTFAPPIPPAPSAAALLAVAGLIGRRSRRRAG